MRYRELPPAEWGKVAPVFHANAALLPSGELAHIFVAEGEDEQIAGFLTLQLVPHMEPLWVAEGDRGRVSLLKLAKLAEGHIGSGTYFVTTESPRVEKALSRWGMHHIPLAVWSKSL